MEPTKVVKYMETIFVAFCAFMVGWAVGKPTKDASGLFPPARIEAPVCPPEPCREEAIPVSDFDGQRIECSSTRHRMEFGTMNDRTYAFCHCGSTPPPADLPPVQVPLR